MTTLAADSKRIFEQVGYEAFQDIPCVATDIIYEGAACGDVSGTCGLISADTYVFLGFAARQADNSAGAASAITVRLQTKGQVQLAVTGVTSTDDVGQTVYATDDDTFTLTSTSATTIGKVARWVSGTTCVVAFEGSFERSL